MKKALILLITAIMILPVAICWGKQNSVKVTDLEKRVNAYISDSSGTPTNIRMSPGGAVKGTFKANSMVMIQIMAKSGKWFYYKIIGNPEEEQINGIMEIGWLHGSVIGFHTSNYGGEKIPLYSKPDKSSSIVVEITEETELHPEDIVNGWVLVIYKKGGKSYKGWIQTEWLCGNSVTNCC